MKRSLLIHTTKAARNNIFTILEKVFNIKRSRVKIRVTFDNPSGYGWRSGGWGELIPQGKDRYLIAINPKSLLSDTMFKGVCAHEAIHIAFHFYQTRSKTHKFWSSLMEFIPQALDILQTHYPQNEELIACVLEPIITLPLLPSPEGGWEIFLPEVK